MPRKSEKELTHGVPAFAPPVRGGNLGAPVTLKPPRPRRLLGLVVPSILERVQTFTRFTK